MTLRDHPLMNYKGNPSWPPAWLWRGGPIQPKGEVGILKRVLSPKVKPLERCFLIIEFESIEFMGALLISDFAFCQEIREVLIENIGRGIQEIGDIDLSYSL